MSSNPGESCQAGVDQQIAAPSVSIIIVNYNAGQFLAASVRSALSVADEVIVVDNASSDSSMQLLDSISDSRLIVLKNSTNLGFAAACNRGARVSKGTELLFLNPDCVIDAGSVESMCRVLRSHAQIGMVGGLLLNPDGTEQGGGRRAIPTPWRSLVRALGLHRLSKIWPNLFFDFHLHKQPLPEGPIEVEAISGACMLVKREAVEDVGLWDEGYFLHCEDLDWCMRFRQKGWKILFVPDAPIVHEKGVSSRSIPFFVEWHKHKGMMRFYKKFFSRQYPIMLMALVALGVWLRFALVIVYHSVRKVVHRPGIDHG